MQNQEVMLEPPFQREKSRPIFATAAETRTGATTPSHRAIYQFGPFKLDPVDRTLLNGARTVDLQPRTFDVLLLLVQRAGSLISKEQFRTEVWQGAVVTDNALTRCIRQLRAALNDSTANPEYVVTVPRHGYRFVARVTSAPDPAPDQERRAAPPVKPLVMVLSFSIELPDDAAKHLSGEITEEIIDWLSDIADLNVMASHSSRLLSAQNLPLSGLAVDYGVTYVVTGSARMAGSQIQLRAECLRADNSVSVWRVRQQVPRLDIARVPRLVAASVYEQLTGKVQKGTVAAPMNERAYHSYLLANAALKHSNFPRAIEHARYSLEHDADNPLAHTLLAQIYLIWAAYGVVPEPDPLVRSQRHLRQAKSAVAEHQAIIRLESQLALYLERDYPKAIELGARIPGPSSVMAALLFYGFRYADGVMLQRRLAENDPLNLQALLFTQRMLRFIGDTEQADYYHQLCLEVDADHLMVLQDSFDIALYEGKLDTADEILQLIFAQKNMPWWPQALSHCWFGSKLEAYRGNTRQALALADELAEKVDIQPTLKAEAYFNARNLDGVFRWMDTGIREFDPGIYQMIAPFSVRTLDDPLMADFVADSRYPQMRKRLGVDQATLATVDWSQLDVGTARSRLIREL